MGKRILLFLLTNILVMTTIMVVWSAIIYFTGWDLSFQSDGSINFAAIMLFSIIVGFAGSFISLGMSRWVAKMMMKVKVLDPNGSLSPIERSVVEKVHRLSRAAGLTHMPEVGIYQSPEVNAFATGPSKKRSLVAVSTGLLQAMDEDAVEGVIAHEVAHVANGDMVTMTLLQGIVNTFVVFLSRIVAIIASRIVPEQYSFIVHFASIIIFQILFSILGSIVVNAYSRHREFHADRGGGDLAGNDKMAHALRSLKAHVNRAKVQNDRTDDSAVATMKISGKGGMSKLFSTHPDLDERIARLEAR
ncbi:heat shock protein HtpX [Alkalihalobacillus alcalophilus ATCC 27647 = CGMCC 1.3604]|uniref:Protease HtpX homolog n=1 Tax=Alkalihalobacillus alcalophilus ATCC 27647 = CGMCC 1.3604 TaxID=1218173 RepID=A0A094XC75_ALKAL|nr:protease HtpX [Alkalihalobacillus alcalophilus]KGA96395.1 protease HtpX [Alkalihalobacillus alcalophilus ATCC 27647 = CGMCC 1.3604]MED1563221.1 protease HtpX [Alkalihalobacillus alcalophilus]THG89998.1 heat shock protein HtpX [Alkalihalobacillus alcalophilus ATCC 27647 = CGMCC 1.3604]